MIRIVKEDSERVFQGDIIANVELIQSADINSDGILEVVKIHFPYVIVLSQDCDLEQDFNNLSNPQRSHDGPQILSVIVAPIYNYEHIRTGEHLENLNLSPLRINSDMAKNIRKNETPRYHYLNFPEDVDVVDSVIDFKHYFTVNKKYLQETKKTNYVGKVLELYREQISLRFANYLSRIGLPTP